MEHASSGVILTLSNLLSAAGWHGTERRVFEAVPHMSDNLSPDDVAQTLRNLDIPTSSTRGSLRRLAREDCPALFVDNAGRMIGVLDARDGKILVSDPDKSQPEWQKRRYRSGQLIRLERFDIASSETVHAEPFDMTKSFGGLFPWLVAASLLTNVMGLMTPLLIMVIYDRVIPAQSTHLVGALCIGVAIIAATDFGFRMARAKAIAYAGSETERRLSHALVRKIMALHLNQIEQTDVERQLARFKQFESLRDIFTGQALSSLLDLPFVIIFLAVLAYIAPSIALLITILAIVFVVAAFASIPAQQALNSAAAKEKSLFQAHIFETTKHQQEIQSLGLPELWTAHSRLLASRSAAASRRARQFQMIGQALSQSLMAIAGLGAILISTLGAIDGAMTTGALIAVMALVWKILTPIVALYTSAPQLLGYLQSKKQVDRVISLPEERSRGAGQSHQRTLSGNIDVTNVTFRYSSTGAVALSQTSLSINASDFIFLAGQNNSGKSTLMGMLTGLYQCTIGTIAFDGIDIRQIAVDDLRQSITYAKRQSDHFYGTIHQNFRLATPDIESQDTLKAIDDMALSDDIAALEEGIDTRLTEAFRATMPGPTMRALALARCFARDTPIYLFNDPSSGLDPRHHAALFSCLQKLKDKKKTVILASADQSLMRLADRFVFMQDGRVVADDRGDTGRKKVMALLEHTKG